MIKTNHQLMIWISSIILPQEWFKVHADHIWDWLHIFTFNRFCSQQLLQGNKKKDFKFDAKTAKKKSECVGPLLDKERITCRAQWFWLTAPQEIHSSHLLKCLLGKFSMNHTVPSVKPAQLSGLGRSDKQGIESVLHAASQPWPWHEPWQCWLWHHVEL